MTTLLRMQTGRFGSRSFDRMGENPFERFPIVQDVVSLIFIEFLHEHGHRFNRSSQVRTLMRVVSRRSRREAAVVRLLREARKTFGMP